MVSCLMGDSTALASAIVRCCPKTNKKFRLTIEVNELKDFAMEFCQVMISHLDSLKEM